MADYSKMSDADLLAMVQPKTDYAKMSDADLLKMVQPKQPSLSEAVTDIPAEIARTAGSNLDAIKAGVTDRGSKGPIEGLMSTGKALLAVPGLLASPITGAARSLIGHPMAQAEHAVGTLIAPEIAKNDDPKKMYEAAAGDVETALSAARPTGFSPRGLSAAPPVATPAPNIQDLKANSRSLYKHPEVENLEIKPQAVADLSTTIENDLLQRGFRPKQAGGTFDEIQSLVPPPGVKSVNAMDLHSARKALGVYAREVDAVGKPTAEAAAAMVAKEHLNDFLPNINQADVASGNAARAAELMRAGDKDWAAAKRAEAIDLQLTRADRQAAKSGSGSNIENAMRQKIAVLLDNPKRTIGYSAPEKAAMESIVRGTTSRNVLRKAGKFGVDGGLSLLLHAGAIIPSHGLNLPVAVAGTAARKVGEALTARAGRNLSEMVRSRSHLAQTNASMNAVQRALLAAPPPRAAAIPYVGVTTGSPSQMRRAQIAQLLAQQ
jgi:hypothetical protein